MSISGTIKSLWSLRKPVIGALLSDSCLHIKKTQKHEKIVTPESVGRMHNMEKSCNLIGYAGIPLIMSCDPRQIVQH